MFREMRRSAQKISDNETLKILSESKMGVLALSGDDDYPYSLPVNYVLYNGKIYIHCAREGHKLDAIGRNEKVSMSVVYADEILQEKFTTLYKSVIVFGRARIITDENEIVPALEALCRSCCPDNPNIDAEIKAYISRTAIIEIAIEHISSKQCIEYLKR